MNSHYISRRSHAHLSGGGEFVFWFRGYGSPQRLNVQHVVRVSLGESKNARFKKVGSAKSGEVRWFSV